MRKNTSIICLFLFAAASLLTAQSSLPNATVGVPFSLDLGQGFSQIPSESGVSFSYSFTVASSSLPPGLNLTPNGLLSGTPITAGTYSFTINFVFNISYMGQNYNFSEPIPLTLTVAGSTGPPVTIAPDALSFTLAQGSTTSVSQSIVISNANSQSQTFTASAASGSGGTWLSVSPANGTVAVFSASPIQVNVNPAGLAAGTYEGTVSISIAPGGQQFSVPVIAVVSSAQQEIELSGTGLRFQALSGAGAPPAQSINVIDNGSTALNFSVSASTITSGQTWLSASPPSGTSSQTSPTPVTVTVNPAGLAAGDYYGQVQFSSPNVANSPQTATIVLNVAAAGSDLAAVVKPTGVIFVGPAGAQNPAAQTISITNASSAQKTYSTATFFEDGNNWFTVQPPGGVVTTASSTSISVQANTSGLPAGVYRGDITLRFVEDGNITYIAVLLVVIPSISSAGIQASAAEIPRATGCSPTTLYPVFTELGSGFSTVAAWPTPMEVTVVDDCGNTMVTGSVVASFSSGDPSLSLSSLGDGRWSATWEPRNASAQVTITANAQQIAPALVGAASIGGTLQANPTTPVIAAGGAVSAASFAAHQPLAPGSFVSIFGTHFSGGQNLLSTLPLSTQLGGTQATLAGRPLPLQLAFDGQINAVIPYDVPPNTTQQLIIMDGPAISVPEPVVVTTAQPAVFTADQSGKGAGIVVGVKPDGTQFVVDTSHPVTAGDAVVIYCAGLGAVAPAVPAGSAAPLSPLSTTTNPVTVMIGGQQANVFFAGLAPGFAGLYQVNAYVPNGVTPGSSVPLVLSVAGQQSTPVTIVVQ